MKKIVLLWVLAMGTLSVSARTVVIDVRTSQEYAAGHIAEALNIDYELIGQEISKAKVARDDVIILYCQSGRRSGIAQDTLKKLGYSKAENYGGMEQARKLLQKP